MSPGWWRSPGRALARWGWVGLGLLLVACAGRPAGLLRPNGVAVAADGSLYIMDRGHARLVHLSAEGRFLHTVGQLGPGPADIYYGWDAAIDAEDHVYIGNMVRNERGDILHDGVKVFSPQGVFLREIGAQDYSPGQAGFAPYGLDVDTQGRLYVVGYKRQALRIFGADGTLLLELASQPGAGDWRGPNDVAVDEGRGLLYISDSLTCRVQQFTLRWPTPEHPQLTYRQTLGTCGRETGQFSYPHYLAVDEATGRLFVGDMGNRRVQILDAEGRFQGQVGVPMGIHDWQVLGLTVGPDGRLYVADALNNAIWVFTPEGQLWARRGLAGRGFQPR